MYVLHAVIQWLTPSNVYGPSILTQNQISPQAQLDMIQKSQKIALKNVNSFSDKFFGKQNWEEFWSKKKNYKVLKVNIWRKNFGAKISMIKCSARNFLTIY